MKALSGPTLSARTLVAAITSVIVAALLVGSATAQDKPTSAPTTTPATTTSTAPSTTSASAPASGPPMTASELPAPDSLQAVNKLGGDGSVILVKWAKPSNESKGVRYAVEIAKSEKDFETGNFKTKIVKPSKNSLASAKPHYFHVFGVGDKDDQTYFAEVPPGDERFFGPLKPPELSPERLTELAGQKLLNDAQLGVAKDALANANALEDVKAALGKAMEALGADTALSNAKLAMEEAKSALVDAKAPMSQLGLFTDAAWALGEARIPNRGGEESTAKQPAVAEYETTLARITAALDDKPELAKVRAALVKAYDALVDAKAQSKADVSLKKATDEVSKAQDGFADPRTALGEARNSATAAMHALAKAPALAKVQARAGMARDAMDEASGKLTKAGKADMLWFARLSAHLKEMDEKATADKVAEINRQTYYYRLAVLRDDQKAYVISNGRPAVVSASARPYWFKWAKLNNLIFSLLFCGIVFAFIEVAKRKPGLFIRKIAGLDAVDEAIGRATEMDRPVFFVHGLNDMDSISTIAAVNVLARVARRAAEHDTHLRVFNNYPIVTAVSQEVVQQAYTQAGRPDAYNADDVSLVASDQFSYVAAVSGNMVREQPGAIFLLGYFYAESLLLAETGASTGAIQVAGTDAYTQLPFFITTCDYTLMGEELYAASAYLSREPRLLGSLRGQDVGKAFLMIAIVLVSIVLTIGALHSVNWNLGWLKSLFSAVAN